MMIRLRVIVRQLPSERTFAVPDPNERVWLGVALHAENGGRRQCGVESGKNANQ